MPATKKSNVSVRLKKKDTTFSTVAGFLGSFNLHYIDGTPHLTIPDSAISTEEKRDYELYYKGSLVCTDKDKNKLRRMGYLIRKNMENNEPN